MKIKAYFQGRTTNFYVIWIFIIAVVVRIPFLFMSLNEAHGDKQTRNAFAARVWREDGFTPLLPAVPTFGGAGDYQDLLEFPIFQWQIWILSYLLPLDVAARIAGLSFFVLGAFFLYLIMLRFLPIELALTVLTVYLFNPFAMKWASSATIDLAATAMLFPAFWLLSRVWRLPPAKKISLCVFAWLLLAGSALMKPWILALWTPFLLLILISNQQNRGLTPLLFSKQAAIALVFAGTALVPALAWQSWAAVRRREFQLDSGPSFLLGSMGDRNAFSVAKILQNEYGFTLGGVFVLVVVLFTMTRRKRNFFWPWFSALVVATLPIAVMTRLYAAHMYYSISVLPAVVVVAVIGFYYSLPKAFENRVSRIAMTLSAWLLSIGYLNYVIVEGMQYFLVPFSEQHSGNSRVSQFSGLIAGLACLAFWFLCRWLLARSRSDFRSIPTTFVACTGSALVTGLLLFYPLRFNSDLPRFTNEISQILALDQASRESLLMLGCDFSTAMYYGNARGLAINGSKVVGGVPELEAVLEELGNYEAVVICNDADISIGQLSGALAGEYLVGSSIGGSYWISLSEPRNFIRVSDNIWRIE